MGIHKEKLITVIIPNYNGAKFIRGCLDSLKEGSVLPQIIVVDNGSTDGSDQIIEKEYPEVLLLRLGANTGFCHAVNAGLHITRTRYAILLNNDTKADRNFVRELYNAIAQSSGAFSAGARMLSMKDPDVIDNAGDLYCAFGWAFARGKAQPADSYSREEEIFSTCAGAAIYRMSVFDEIGFFDERHFCYLEDVDICYRARIHGYRNLYAPKAVVYHYGSASSGSVYNAFKEEMTAGNNRYLLYKNMPAFQYALNAPLIALGTKIKEYYFAKRGLKEAYCRGLERGKILKAIDRDNRWLENHELPVRKGTIAQEAVLPESDERAKNTLPLYLGGKVPFEMRNLPYYLQIQLELWTNCLRRLENRP